jgi:hypothetical protein
VSHDDVVRGGDEDGSRSFGWVLIIGLAALAAVVSLLSHHSKPAAEPALPVPTLSPIPAASPTASPPPLGQLVSDVPRSTHVDPSMAVLARRTGYVLAHDICPIVTDHRTTMEISFVLENITPVRVIITRVTPVLPLKGFRPTGVELQFGLCKDRAKPALLEPRLAAGGAVLVTLSFALPDTCPAPYPILLRVMLTIDGQRRVEDLPLLSDLGGVRFDTCKTVSPPD